MRKQKKGPRSHQRRRNKIPKKRPLHLHISQHFSIKDFLGPPPQDDAKPPPYKISLGLIGALELLQSNCPEKIRIIKGFENCDTVKSRKNYHLLGLAADITVENMPIQELFLLAEKIPDFVGIGLNIKENHVHVDKRKQDERSLWVEENNKIINLTEENRAKYLDSE